MYLLMTLKVREEAETVPPCGHERLIRTPEVGWQDSVAGKVLAQYEDLHLILYTGKKKWTAAHTCDAIPEEAETGETLGLAHQTARLDEGHCQ